MKEKFGVFLLVLVMSAYLTGAYFPNTITSSGVKQRSERVTVSATCSASPCTIASQSGSWVSSITRASAGTYTVNFTSGIFSAAPSCDVMSDNYIQYFSALPSTSSFSFRTTDLTGTFQDTKFNIICMGPRN